MTDSVDLTDVSKLQLAAESARLRQRIAEQDKMIEVLSGKRDIAFDALIDERDRLQARLDTATAHVEELRGQRDEARAEVAYLRGRIDRVLDRHDECHTLCNADEYELTVAASAWRAAQPDVTAPTDRPPSNLSQDHGADDGAGTEGSQAQGGAQGREVWVADDPHDEWGTGRFVAQPAPAGPAGLDAAVDAGWHEYMRMDNLEVVGPDRVRLILRAAAPHLRTAALNEAADEIKARRDGPQSAGGRLAVPGLLLAEAMIRDRAGRIGGGE